MSQTFVLRSLACVLLLAAPPIASAQRYEDSLHIRVDVIDERPLMDGVVMRGDTALFITNTIDSVAYGFDRRKRRFFRTRAVRNVEPYHRANAASSTMMIADSLTVSQVQLSEELYSYVLEDPRGKRIALRGPRVEGEKRWRRAHGADAEDEIQLRLSANGVPRGWEVLRAAEEVAGRGREGKGKIKEVGIFLQKLQT